MQLYKEYFNGMMSYKLEDIELTDIEAQQFYEQLRIGAAEGFDSVTGFAIMRLLEGIKE